MLDRIEIDRMFERARFHVMSQLNDAGLLAIDTTGQNLQTTNERAASIDSLVLLTHWNLGNAWDIAINTRISDASSDIDRQTAFQ